MEKCGGFMAWTDAKTIEEAEKLWHRCGDTFSPRSLAEISGGYSTNNVLRILSAARIAMQEPPYVVHLSTKDAEILEMWM